MNEQMKITSTPEASLKLALELAEAYGFSVVPCGKVQNGKLKRPLISAWQRNGSADPVAIRKMWDGQQGPLAVGIVCGLSDIWVLDVDKEHVEMERDPDTGKQVPTGRVFYGLEELRTLEAEFGQLPKTLTVRTGSGGLHFYFRQPKGRTVGSNSTGRLKEYAGAIDVRGTNGQVIGPRNVYMWNGQIVSYEVIDNSPIADAPEWLLDLILDRAPVQAMFPEEPELEEEPARPWTQPVPAPAQEADQEWRLTEDEEGNLIFHCPNLADLEPWVDYSDPVARKIRREVTNEALKEINLHPEVILTPDKSGKGYICPVCKSGSRKNGTGMSQRKDGNPIPHFTCWSCQEIVNASTFDIIGIVNRLDPKESTNFVKIMKIACKLYGIRVDEEVDRRMDQADMALQERQAQMTASAPAGSAPAQAAPTAATSATSAQSQPLQAQDSVPAPKNKITKAESKPEMDFTEYYKQCVARRHETDYTRGISDTVLDLYNVGYDPEWRNPDKPTAPASPRLIIPKSKNCYFARDTRPLDRIQPNQKGFTKITVKTGSENPFFNFEALSSPDSDFPVFITEGEIDALSIIQTGIAAVALGGTAYASRFLTELDKRISEGMPVPPLVLAMDSDEAGRGAQSVLRIGLQGRSLAFSELTLPDGCKDPNIALNTNKDALFNACHEAVTKAQAEGYALKERMKEDLRNQCAGRALDTFLEETRNREAKYYPTGVRELDFLLDGGLYAGLYIIGAISSLGKTTFALSIADYIAAHGQDVLIFSLEMARNELIAKSVSRITGRISLSGDEFAASTAYAQSTRSVLGKRTALYGESEQKVLDMAFDEYRRIGEHLFISEGVGNIGVEQVRAQVQNHTRIMGRPPVVIIDYLQILAPADTRSTDKQNTDKAVLELKRISRDFATPVFAISSFNRDNYAQSVSMVAFKESGAIEYSSDVLLGMQYNGMDAPDEMLRKHNRDTARTQPDNVKLLTEFWQWRAYNGDEVEIQIKVLKNRNGRKGTLVQKFWPRFNYFEDLPETETERRRKEKEDYHQRRAKEQAARRSRKKESVEAAEIRRREDEEAQAQMEANMSPEQLPFEPLEDESKPALAKALANIPVVPY